MFTKRQIKALLEVLANDNTRPALEHAYLDTYNDKPVLVATDSYKLITVYLEGGGDLDWPKLAGRSISREDLTRWYKLASNSDRLQTEDIVTMAQDRSDDFKYPDWQKIIGQTKPASADQISFNAKYTLILETLADCHLCYELNGPNNPLIAQNNSGLYLIMPLRS